MFIPKSKSIKFQNSPICTISEYNLSTKNLGLATAKINGRYPGKGVSANLKCEQVYFVISGSATIHSNKGNFKIKKNDTYYLKPKEKYWIQGKNLFVIIVNSPKWDKKQYKNFSL